MATNEEHAGIKNVFFSFFVTPPPFVEPGLPGTKLKTSALCQADVPLIKIEPPCPPSLSERQIASTSRVKEEEILSLAA